MIKAVSLLVRRPGLSHEAFRKHWFDVHAPMSANIPGLRGYVLSEIVEEQIRPDIPSLGITTPIDGIAETWVDSLEARAAMAQAPETMRWYADGASFIGAIKTYLTEEKIVIPVPDAPRPAFKNVSLLIRKDSQTRAEFLHHWREVHAPMALGVPELRGFVLSTVLESASRPDVGALAAPEIDGIAESWADSLEARQRMVASPEAKTWYADGAASIGRLKALLTRETVIIPPPS